ncbi:MAG: aldo/keto reductase [Armatimonadota bacterium]|nr:aldo/keto reductase [Armatimonadota bacterium]
MKRWVKLAENLPKVCRLGLATRGDKSKLMPEDCFHALERGINYWNWCSVEDGMSQAIRQLGRTRKQIVIAFQLEARTEDKAWRELEQVLKTLKVDKVEVVTFYYVERESEWQTIAGKNGALKAMFKAKEQGLVNLIGLTSHQRKLAAKIALTKEVDLLMVRYNAAHRSAEQDVFPVTQLLNMPVVVYTCTRWAQLMRPTPFDPPNFSPPPAKEWYRFALAHPAVSVALMAPSNRKELDENLTILDDWREPTQSELEVLVQHGERVRQYRKWFP